jgi:putative transposase
LISLPIKWRIAGVRALTVVDVHTRESLAIEAGQKLKGEDVRTLNQIRIKRGVPKVLFCDNGSEFTSQLMDLWAYHHEVRIDSSRESRPTMHSWSRSMEHCGRNVLMCISSKHSRKPSI